MTPPPGHSGGCICLGPSGSGKTLLLKRLQSDSVSEATSTVETVGSNIIEIPKKYPLSSDTPTTYLSIREIGGSIAPLWPSYYSPTTIVLFLVDISNPFQVSLATVQLMELLAHEKLLGSKVLVVLSKMDLTNRKRLNHLKFMMRLDAILTQAGKRASVLEVSAATGEGVEAVREWIVGNWPKSVKGGQGGNKRGVIKGRY